MRNYIPIGSISSGTMLPRIDAAIAKADKMQTPWFAHEYIIDTCADEIEGMARCDAEDAVYAKPGERIVHGIIRK